MHKACKEVGWLAKERARVARRAQASDELLKACAVLLDLGYESIALEVHGVKARHYKQA